MRETPFSTEQAFGGSIRFKVRRYRILGWGFASRTQFLTAALTSHTVYRVLVTLSNRFCGGMLVDRDGQNGARSL